MMPVPMLVVPAAFPLALQIVSSCFNTVLVPLQSTLLPLIRCMFPSCLKVMSQLHMLFYPSSSENHYVHSYAIPLVTMGLNLIPTHSGHVPLHFGGEGLALALSTPRDGGGFPAWMPGSICYNLLYVF